MIPITTHIPIAQLKDLQSILDPVAARRVFAAAVNSSGRFGNTRVKKAIRDEIPLKLQAVNKFVRFTPAMVAETSPTARIEVARQKQPMKTYSARQTRAGVTVKPRKNQPRELLRSAFIVKKLGEHVYKRRGKERYPIERKFGPTGVGVLVGKPEMFPAVEKIIREKFAQRLSSTLEAYLSGKGGFRKLSASALSAIADRIQ